MSALSITAANVLRSTAGLISSGIAGETITAGQPLYADAADSGHLKLADNDASAATKVVVGIALTGASDGQPIQTVTADSAYTPGGTLTVGERYYVGSTAGEIIPSGDLSSGDTPIHLFTATTASVAVLAIVNGGGELA